MSSQHDPFDPFRSGPPRSADSPAAAPSHPASRPIFDPFAARPATKAPASGAFDPFAPRPATRPGVPATPTQGLPVAGPVARPTQPTPQPAPVPAPRTAIAVAPATPLARTEPEFWATARQMRFSQGLTAAELADLTALVQRKLVPTGSVIIKQGEPVDAGAIVGQGQGHMRYETPGRPPVQFGTLRPGLIVGDGAVTGGGYHGASVLAASDCLIWTFTAGDIARLRAKNPSLFEKLCGLVRDQQSAR